MSPPFIKTSQFYIFHLNHNEVFLRIFVSLCGQNFIHTDLKITTKTESKTVIAVNAVR